MCWLGGLCSHWVEQMSDSASASLQGERMVSLSCVWSCVHFSEVHTICLTRPSCARNDKHIACTDPAVTDLLYGNGWLRSKYWEVTTNALGCCKVLQGLYLVCNGGYNRWPCLVYPVKVGDLGSVSMKFSKLVESVRKDIEGVFGILKIWFRFLKSFTNLCRQKHIDYAFVTCCILHNKLLEEDRYLDADLPDYPGGMASALKLKFRRSRQDCATTSLWSRGYDDTPDDEEEEAEQRRPIQEARRFAQEWENVMQALMNHYQFSN